MPARKSLWIILAIMLMPFAVYAAGTALTQPPAWNYTGGGNDDEGWGELSPDYATCESGTNQSPVGINYTTISTMPPLKPHYRKSQATIERKERTVVVAIQGNNTLVDEGHVYKLIELRLHSPAEHTVQDALFAIELQLIHKDAKGKILIVGLLGKLGAPNATLQSLLQKVMPNDSGKVAQLSFNPGALLPEGKGYYAYSGSLTWPPCTEDVQWRIYKEPVTLSQKQLEYIGKLIGRNARLLQPIYMRSIKETME